MEITAKTEVSTKEIALILGVTARWVQQLTQDGVLPTIGRNQYNLSETIQAYAEYRAGKIPDATELEKAEAELSIKKANAVIKVLEAKELQRKMHRSEDVAALTEGLVFTIKEMLLALPERLAVDISTMNKPAEAANIIRNEVYAIMKELSQYKFDP
ncbi:MAG TPA: hypothetical protein DIW17_04055 [Clostridiales bacterium]|nr:hypothetical protein [Clostridiales bacterium]